MYDELLEKLQNGRTEFERKLNAEKQKLQDVLNVRKTRKRNDGNENERTNGKIDRRATSRMEKLDGK